MDIKAIKNMLKKHGLKLTSPRLNVLEVLISSDRAVTYGEIINANTRIIDRVTVYRTLRLLEDIGLIHRIMGAGEMPAYALSIAPNGIREHIHFHCTKCQGVYCLHDQAMPIIVLPAHYQVNSMNLILTGWCRSCNNATQT